MVNAPLGLVFLPNASSNPFICGGTKCVCLALVPWVIKFIISVTFVYLIVTSNMDDHLHRAVCGVFDTNCAKLRSAKSAKCSYQIF